MTQMVLLSVQNSSHCVQFEARVQDPGLEHMLCTEPLDLVIMYRIFVIIGPDCTVVTRHYLMYFKHKLFTWQPNAIGPLNCIYSDITTVVVFKCTIILRCLAKVGSIVLFIV